MKYSITFLGLAVIAAAEFNGTEPIYKHGSDITTATLTKTHVHTVTSCPPEKASDCPYKNSTVVTTTIEVYTTVCPVSLLPGYTEPAAPAEPGAPISQIPDGQVQGPSAVPAEPGAPISQIPDGQIQGPSAAPAPPAVTPAPAPIPGTGTGVPVVPTPTSPVLEFTGAAVANKVGGGLAAAAFVAALL